MDQLKVDTCHLIIFFFKKKFKKKGKEKLELGWLGHPLGAKGVAEPPQLQLFLSFFFLNFFLK
jgi:hypothetical protein